MLAVRADAPLFYANVVAVKEHILELARQTEPAPRAVVVDLGQSTELDIEDVDALAELADALARDAIELRLAEVRAPAGEVLRRSGLAGRVAIAPTLDAAVRDPAAPHPSESRPPERGPAIT